MERTALIFNVQKYSIYDGPGVRTLVFFKGCPLRCKWCSNPESQSRSYQIMLMRNLCNDTGACISVCPVGIHSLDGSGKHAFSKTTECIGCRLCENTCPSRAIAIVGQVKAISELMAVIEQDRFFYESSGGGVTLGGGEALAQPEAALNLLMSCKKAGINTAIETTGFTSLEILQKVAECIDLFLYDIKHMDTQKHYEGTGVHNEQILNNLQWLLENRYNVKVRVPLLKGFNDSDDNLIKMAEFLQPYQMNKNFKGIDILPYHKLGVNKYNQLERDYLVDWDPNLSDEDLTRVENTLKLYELPVSIIKH